ncbi:sensor histidine kinase [Desnuesiella massiliensis]|uniref:sensor histidine kinase n=1 Tax=Desnuesiella massiliensis TaxID=1650662 RepID=UPI0006E16EC4|nr:ATP-binding protein [Desnuesiella massiliensis]
MSEDYSVSLIKASSYKIIVSLALGFIGFVGTFYSSRFDFNGFSINFTWSIILPLLVTVAWGMTYGIISITLGLVVLYPFILGSYNGWASIVPAISLCLWIIIHGYGGQKRGKKHRFYYNIYFLQFIYVVIRMIIYMTLFPVLINLNQLSPPPWNPQAYVRVDMGIVCLFAIKGIIVESILLALCDALLLLPFIRRIFRLQCSSGAKYNTRIMGALVIFGLSFTIIVLEIQNYIIDRTHLLNWLINPDEKIRITFLLATILFFIMGGITIRFLQRVLETQEELKVREKQLDNAIKEIKTLNDELEQRVADRTSELQNAVYELEGFAYTISHDLKSPLRAIDTYSNFIQEEHKDSLNNEAYEIIGSIQEVCKDMIGLINRLLEYSITSKATLFKEKLQVKNIIEEVFQQFKILNQDKKMELIFKGKFPEINVDKVFFKQVITNIISNAVKFSRHRESIKITVGCDKSYNEYVFYIKDNGVGFDMKYSSKLFNVFQRLHRKQDFEGTGIGLATIKKIIQKHGGRVWIEGVLNEGAALYFTIPSIKNTQNGDEDV